MQHNASANICCSQPVSLLLSWGQVNGTCQVFCPWRAHVTSTKLTPNKGTISNFHVTHDPQTMLLALESLPSFPTGTHSACQVQPSKLQNQCSAGISILSFSPVNGFEGSFPVQSAARVFTFFSLFLSHSSLWRSRVLAFRMPMVLFFSRSLHSSQLL